MLIVLPCRGNALRAHRLPVVCRAFGTLRKAYPWNTKISEEPTGVISQESRVESQESIYDLSGRKVNGPLTKGIYIKNGKKVLVK